MKQLIFFLFICSSFFCFSQGAKQTEINWITGANKIIKPKK